MYNMVNRQRRRSWPPEDPIFFSRSHSEQESGVIASTSHKIPVSSNKQTNEVCKSVNLTRNRQIASIFQHYYPEGNWGYVVLITSLLSVILVSGFSYGYGILWSHFRRRYHIRDEAQLGLLGAVSSSVSLFISPLTIGMCRLKSTRLTAVLGGLISALGCLFTSFANQFHQLFLSYGLMIGIGVGMTRDPATLMIGQYFKRKRELMEMILVSGSGLGLSVMSAAMKVALTELGWRLGLQAITCLILPTFFLGTFYRSASLYHPQRRAILHLKSQKRKIKNKDKEKNKLQNDSPPLLDFSTLKSRTVQIILLSITCASLGLHTPIIYLNILAKEDSHQLLLLSNILGISWIVGVLLVASLILIQHKKRNNTRRYCVQLSLTSVGLSILILQIVNSVQEISFFLIFYGLSLGAYNYSLKMYLYEKVRARNFARAWSLAQCAMALPNLLGVPLSGYLNSAFNDRSGFLLSSVAILTGSLTLTLISLHQRRLRRTHDDRIHAKESFVQNGSFEKALNGNCLINSHPHQNEEFSSEKKSHSMRKPSFSDQDDICPPISLINTSHSSLPLNALLEIHKQSKNSNFSQEGIPDMDVPDDLLLDDYLLDNITSCDKVENCLMYSEYEQNLIKETEDVSSLYLSKRGRKWSLFRLGSNRVVVNQK